MSTPAHQAEERLEQLLRARDFPPPAKFAARAKIADPAVYEQAAADPQAWWAEQARERLDWDTAFTEVLDDSSPPFYRWFADGTLNVSHNCLDRHVQAGHGDRVAFHWYGEEGEGRDLTYAGLLADVQRLANGLKARGVRKGDAVGIYLHFVGAGARRDEDGYFWITGRIDDVINVSGHRLSTAEIESALVAHPVVAEAAVIAASDELTGQSIVAYVTLRAGISAEPALKEALRQHVAERIGKLARPKRIIWAEDVPKTRSGKIMRRLLRDIAEGRNPGDATTLHDASVLAKLQQATVQDDPVQDNRQNAGTPETGSTR